MMLAYSLSYQHLKRHHNKLYRKIPFHNKFLKMVFNRVYKTFKHSNKNIQMRDAQTSTPSRTSPSTTPTPSSLRKAQRRKSTNMVLSFSALTFFLSWAPVNIFAALINFYNPIQVKL